MYNFIRSRWLIPVTVLAVFSNSVLGVHAGSTTRTGMGKISGINLTYDTVVVEVPIIDDQLMTVGGPLADGAQLKKENHSAALEDFEIGEKVTVKWRSTDDRPRILALFSR